jgi:hypothetical protein
MLKTQQELYELALSKMAIPTCECLLDDSTDTKSIKNNKDNKHDSTRTTRPGTLLAKT